MSRKAWVRMALVVFVVLNAFVFFTKMQRKGAPERLRAQTREKTTKQIAGVLRAQAKHSGDRRSEKYISDIGGLAQSPYWNKKLPLTDFQSQALNTLDSVIWRARLNSFGRDADYVDTNPADYNEYVLRSDWRRQDAIHHGSAMAALGLLSEPQAALLAQYELKQRDYRLNFLRDSRYLQDLLGITEKQRERLVHLGKKGRGQRSRLNWFSTPATDEERSAFYTKVAEIKEEADREVEDILSKQQLQAAEQLAAGPQLPIFALRLPRPSEAELAKINLEELSPVFRVLANEANALKLSQEERKLVQELGQLTKSGVFWIDHGDSPNKDELRSKFIHHSEQVALEGILSQHQAKQTDKYLRKS